MHHRLCEMVTYKFCFASSLSYCKGNFHVFCGWNTTKSTCQESCNPTSGLKECGLNDRSLPHFHSQAWKEPEKCREPFQEFSFGILSCTYTGFLFLCTTICLTLRNAPFFPSECWVAKTHRFWSRREHTQYISVHLSTQRISKPSLSALVQSSSI